MPPPLTLRSIDVHGEIGPSSRMATPERLSTIAAYPLPEALRSEIICCSQEACVAQMFNE